jgi:hypothetical protein
LVDRLLDVAFAGCYHPKGDPCLGCAHGGGVVGTENIYTYDERVGATLKRAYADATAWIEQNQRAAGTDTQ